MREAPDDAASLAAVTGVRVRERGDECESESEGEAGVFHADTLERIRVGM